MRGYVKTQSDPGQENHFTFKNKPKLKMFISDYQSHIDIGDQLLTAIEEQNVDQFHILLITALAQPTPIDWNQIHQNGQTFLTFAG